MEPSSPPRKGISTLVVANSLRDASSILAASEAGMVTLATTTIYVNCPVVS